MLAGQLTIWDLPNEIEHEQDAPHRLGDGPELGMVLLQPLLARGWRLHQTRAFAGGARTLFILANGVFEVKREGDQLSDVAVELFEEAGKLAGAAA